MTVVDLGRAVAAHRAGELEEEHGLPGGGRVDRAVRGQEELELELRAGGFTARMVRQCQHEIRILQRLAAEKAEMEPSAVLYRAHGTIDGTPSDRVGQAP